MSPTALTTEDRQELVLKTLKTVKSAVLRTKVGSVLAVLAGAGLVGVGWWFTFRAMRWSTRATVDRAAPPSAGQQAVVVSFRNALRDSTVQATVVVPVPDGCAYRVGDALDIRYDIWNGAAGLDQDAVQVLWATTVSTLGLIVVGFAIAAILRAQANKRSACLAVAREDIKTDPWCIV